MELEILMPTSHPHSLYAFQNTLHNPWARTSRLVIHHFLIFEIKLWTRRTKSLSAFIHKFHNNFMHTTTFHIFRSITCNPSKFFGWHTVSHAMRSFLVSVSLAAQKKGSTQILCCKAFLCKERFVANMRKYQWHALYQFNFPCIAENLVVQWFIDKLFFQSMTLIVNRQFSCYPKGP